MSSAGAALSLGKEAVLRYLAAIVALAGALIAYSTPASAHRGRPSVEQIIRTTFPDDQARALCIAGYESTGNPRTWNPAAQNGSNTGLFQVDQDTWDWRRNVRAIPIVGRLDWSRMHDAAYNARAARRIYLYVRKTRGNGWLPWSTRGLCGA